MTSLASQVATQIMGWPNEPNGFWRPHTHIEDAWRVVAEMERRGYDFSLRTENHVVGFSKKKKTKRSGMAHNFSSLDDVPRAICEAALVMVRSK